MVTRQRPQTDLEATQASAYQWSQGKHLQTGLEMTQPSAHP
jgi:hypothetical protein